MSWGEFRESTKEPDYLAMTFLKNFERAGVEKEEERKQNALNGMCICKHCHRTQCTPTQKNQKCHFTFTLCSDIIRL